MSAGADEADWAETVTTALLGTSRRALTGAGPVDDRGAVDPAVRVLQLAAEHRAVALAGRLRGTVPPPDVAPAPDRPVAPARAQTLLDDVLAAPDPALVGAWLDACVRHGRSAAPHHWTALARLAARSTHYDRPLLGRALGARGRWFLTQNPDWRRLAADAADAAGPAEPIRPPTVEPLPPEALAAQPERLFAQPDPWPPGLVAAAYAVVGALRLGRHSRAYAAAVGARLPPEHYPTVAAAATFHLEHPDATPATRRAVRDAFAALEGAAYTRAAIAEAFDPDAPPLRRTEIDRV